MTSYRSLAEAIEALERGRRTSKRPEDRRLAIDYLAALAPLLARAALGQDILGDLAGVERLLGHTWLIDQAPFEEGLRHWRAFKDEYERGVMAGMTVNERLAAAGLLDTFDQARAAGDRDGVAHLLRQVHVDEASIARILDEI